MGLAHDTSKLCLSLLILSLSTLPLSTLPLPILPLLILSLLILPLSVLLCQPRYFLDQFRYIRCQSGIFHIRKIYLDVRAPQSRLDVRASQILNLNSFSTFISSLCNLLYVRLHQLAVPRFPHFFTHSALPYG
jgi:hypothetical protein